MEEEIKEIIEKNLPAHVGDILKKSLERLNELERLIKSAKEENDSLCEENEHLENVVKDLKKLKINKDDLFKKEKELEERELNLSISILEIKLEEANERATLVKDFVENLTRNVSYRKSIYDSESIPGYTNAQGYYVGDRNVTKCFNQEEEIV